MIGRRILRHGEDLARFFSLSPHSPRQLPKPGRNPTFLIGSDSANGEYGKLRPPEEPFASLCANGRFQDAVDALFRRRGRVDDAVELLDILDKSASLRVYSPLFRLCLRHDAVNDAIRVFQHALSSGFRPDIVISNRLIALFSRSGRYDDARNVFDEISDRDACSFNTMISSYAKRGDMEEACRLFNRMPPGTRDGFSWSSMMSGYIRHGQPSEALRLYREMQMGGRSDGNRFTVSSALAASAAIFSLRSGKEIHGRVIRRELASDAVLWSALSDMYAKCGSIAPARHIFNGTPNKDVVSWTAMIGRYLESGRIEEALNLFSDMLRSRVKPNDFTFAAILNVCSERTMEIHGKQAHGNMIRIGCDPSSFAGGALIDMYFKCGNVDSARKVFDSMPNPDLVSWTCLISGLAQNGYPLEALGHFDSLLSSHSKPDHITFVGALSACTHAGLVDRGLEIFWSIEKDHSLSHTSDHYACVVDLLSRAGRFDEAEDIVRKMPMKPDKFLWASLLGGCRIHGNIRLARLAAEALFQLEPENAATYVTLANIYATAGLWDKVASTRQLMEEKGAVKKPGSSWIEAEKKIHRFLVGDDSHPRIKEIHSQLEKLSAKMKEEGYIPDTHFVLHDVEDEQKEQDLVYHSEKLAVAYGIIATPPPAAIKVFKNLRICGDCHTAMKFISRITRRKIIVRDSSRFHHFDDGICACGDYW